MAYAPSAALERRHATVRAALADQSLDALVVTSLPNVLYLTNFTGSSAIVILTATQVLFMTDSRYLTALADMKGSPRECPGLRLCTVESSYDETLAAALPSLVPGGALGGSVRVGFEASHLSVARHAWLQEALRGHRALGLVATERVVERARLVKDTYEVGVLAEAGRRLSGVATGLFGDVRAGRSERDIAATIERRMYEAGFEKPAFDTIVAGGPNSALPHARPGERKLIEGDLVVLDFGGVYDSYCVDLTRTVVVGKASDRARTVYQAVLLAHDRAIAAVRPGVEPWAVDAAARDVLAERGMAEAFGHGTGHGLGLEVHEDPRVSRRRPKAGEAGGEVAPGMVFTIEPGAYFPGWGGVRIEDDVLVTRDGVDLLTNARTDLLELS